MLVRDLPDQPTLVAQAPGADFFAIDDGFVEFLVVVRAEFAQDIRMPIEAGFHFLVIADGARGRQFVIAVNGEGERRDGHRSPFGWQIGGPLGVPPVPPATRDGLWVTLKVHRDPFVPARAAG